MKRKLTVYTIIVTCLVLLFSMGVQAGSITISKKKATDCTPAETLVDVEVTKTYDPITKEDVTTADGYDPDADDDVHACSDIRPTVSVNSTATGTTVTASVSSGTHPIASYTLEVNGAVVKQGTSAGTISYNVGSKLTGTVTVKITARDNAGYTSTASQEVTISGH